MRNPFSASRLTALLALSLVAGCGWYTSESPDLVRDQGNSFGDNSENQILDEDGALPDTSRPAKPADPRSVSFFVEATSGMQNATVTQQLLEWILPTSAYAVLDAGERISGATISVAQLDYQGEIISGNVISPSDYSSVRNPDGSYTVTFSGSLPNRLDLVLVAELPNGVKLRHAVPTQNSSLRINAVTEYAVRRVYERFGFTAQSQLDAFVSCSTGDAECENQNDQRVTNWLALMEGLQDFEIDLPDSLNLEELMTYLDNTLPVKQYVAEFARAIPEDKLTTSAGQSITPVMDARDGTYNSVYFGLGMNQGNPDSTRDNLIFSSQASVPLIQTGNERTTYLYPSFVFSPSILGVINNLLVETTPFERRTHTLVAPANYASGLLPTNDDIVQFVGSTISFLNTEGLMDLARIQFQVVLNREEPDPTGWLFNPHYNRVYTMRNSTSSENSDSFASAFWRTGQILALEKSGSNFERRGRQETQNTFAWSMHSAAAPNNTSFALGTLDARRYAVISLQQRFATDPAIVWETSMDHWTINGTRIDESQPTPADTNNLGGSDVFNTQSIGRSFTDSAIAFSSSQSGDTEIRELENLPNLRLNSSGGYDDLFKGRIGVDDWSGISDPLGNLLSFTLENGSGIAHAIAVSDDVPDLRNSTFYLQGNSISVDNTSTRIHNHNGSTLSVDGTGTFTLDLEEITLTGNHGTRAVDSLADTSAQYTVNPQTNLATLGTAIRNQVVLDFPDPTGGANNLVLEGMAASGGNLLVLRVRYGDRVGLLYGYRQLRLTKDSD